MAVGGGHAGRIARRSVASNRSTPRRSRGGRGGVVAAVFAFAISLGEFGATVLISRPEFPTASIAIYSFIGKPGALNFGRALAMSTILMIATASGILLIERLRIKGVAEF